MESAPKIDDVFENVFNQHYQNLCSYAYHFLKDTQSSEDVVQEIFIKVWERQKADIGGDKLKFYLFTAVRNNCLTLLRKNRKNFRQELTDGDAVYEMNIQMDDKETRTSPKELISKALDQLPPKCREVFILSRLSGQTYQQIADTLEISKKTVENQMGKAISKMKAFAKQNGVYLVALYAISIEKNIASIIGVYLEKLFY